MDLTQEAILSLLLEEGGKVQNTVLLSEFKGCLNCSDPAEKKQNRDIFKTFVNNVAVVKEFEDVKYIVIRKKYHHLLKDPLETNVQKTIKVKLSEPTGESDSPVEGSECRRPTPPQDGGGKTSDIVDNSEESTAHFGINENTSNSNELQSSPVELALQRSRTADFTPKTYLKFTVEQTSNINETNPHGEAACPKNTETTHKPFALPLRMPPIQLSPHNLKTSQDHLAKVSAEQETCVSPRNSQESVSISSPQSRRNCKSTKPSDEPSNTDTVPLDHVEHEWLVKSAAGLWGQVYGLLMQDPQLAEKRDFMSGFTALHWAAKSGNSEMVCKIIELSRKGGKEVDVNAKTHGGYTPLHIAAIHDQEFVINLLVHDYGADGNLRDNCGKKPHHYLHKGVSSEVRKLLGEPKVLHQEMPHDKDEMEPHKHLHTISRLFQPHPMGHKKKHKQRAGFYSLVDDPKDERDEHMSMHRILSDVFS